MNIHHFFSLAGIIITLFLLPQDAFAATHEQVIFSYDFLKSPKYLSSDAFWQISNNTDDGLYAQEQGLAFKNDGDAYLVYPFSFSYHDYDQLMIEFMSDEPVVISIIPDVTSTGLHSYELRQEFPASDITQHGQFSLRLPFFKEPVLDIGLNFYTGKQSEVVIGEISLKKGRSTERWYQAAVDYLTVAPYSPFTVNVLPTPRIFGRSAAVYLLPLILLLLVFLLSSKKWRFAAFTGFALLWIVTDVRMSYEFLAHRFDDYRRYIEPPTAEKQLRNYGNFYQFVDWVNSQLGAGQDAINFHQFGSAHFPRLMQYLLYPTVVSHNGLEHPTFVIYNHPDILFNQDDQRLYRGDRPLSGPGEVVAFFDDRSFIFEEKNND